MLKPQLSIAPPAGDTRVCPRCETDQPSWSFVYAEDPATKATHRGVRRWCGACLLGRGHVTQRRLDAARTTYEATREAARRAELEAARAAEDLDRVARAAEAAERDRVAALTVDRVAQRALGPVADRGSLQGARFDRITLTDAQRAQVADKISEHAAVNALVDAAHADPVFARALARAAAALDVVAECAS